MDLEELKSTWNSISSKQEMRNQLSAEELQKILKKRTIDISEKIARNIKIGMWIILIWVLLGFATDILLTPFIEKNLDKPYLTEQLMFWTFLLEVLNYILIFSAIIIFWVRYKKTIALPSDSYNLRSKLTQTIGVLESYKRMFYIVLFIVILYVILSFSSGFFMEIRYQMTEMGVDFDKFSLVSWIVVVASFIISLGVLTLIYYLLFNLFFKRLYGRYLKQLKSTLLELNEASDQTT